MIFAWLWFLCGRGSGAGPEFPTSTLLPVMGRPFAASYEEVVRERESPNRTKRRWQGKFYRAAEGSSRVQGRLPVSPLRTSEAALIHSPAGGTTRLLDLTRSRVVMEIPAPDLPGSAPPSNKALWQFFDGMPVYTGTFTTVEGFRCEVVQLQKEGKEVGERWWSEDLQIAVFERKVNGADETIIRFFDIVLGEPDAQLFKVPAHFR